MFMIDFGAWLILPTKQGWYIVGHRREHNGMAFWKVENVDHYSDLKILCVPEKIVDACL